MSTAGLDRGVKPLPLSKMTDANGKRLIIDGRVIPGLIRLSQDGGKTRLSYP